MLQQVYDGAIDMLISGMLPPGSSCYGYLYLCDILLEMKSSAFKPKEYRKSNLNLASSHSSASPERTLNCLEEAS